MATMDGTWDDIKSFRAIIIAGLQSKRPRQGSFSFQSFLMALSRIERKRETAFCLRSIVLQFIGSSGFLNNMAHLYIAASLSAFQ